MNTSNGFVYSLPLYCSDISSQAPMPRRISWRSRRQSPRWQSPAGRGDLGRNFPVSMFDCIYVYIYICISIYREEGWRWHASCMQWLLFVPFCTVELGVSFCAEGVQQQHAHRPTHWMRLRSHGAPYSRSRGRRVVKRNF